MTEDPPQHDHRYLVLIKLFELLKYLVVGGLILAGIYLLNPVVATIAGKETIFQVDIGLSISIGINIALAGVAQGQRRRLRNCRRQLSAATGGNP